MQHVFNAYVGRVLEEMVRQDVPMESAKSICREKLNFLERSYVNLVNVRFVADQLVPTTA